MPSTSIEDQHASLFDDDEGWEDMPVVRESDEFANGLDEEDQKKYHYVPQAKKDSIANAASGSGKTANATGEILDVDYRGYEWREKAGDNDESEYTRLRMNEEDDADEVHLRTRYLFDEDKAMTPLSQMQATKNMLTEAQRIAYVGICALVSREMADQLKRVKAKELKPAIQDMELWSMKILGRLYYHMELATAEQKMIENLALHGVRADDLVPSLMTTHTVANPEYDPAEAQKQADKRREDDERTLFEEQDDISEATVSLSPTADSPKQSSPIPPSHDSSGPFQTTARVLENTATSQLAGVTTSLSSVDENVTLDIRWTVLCDLFLVLIADSVYDARSRVLLENVGIHLGLGWLDLVKFEQRITEALEIQEGAEKTEQRDVLEGREKSSRRRRYMMVGLATLGGGLVIGLSAGLLAPVIGAGIGAALTTVGISGTATFLGGTAGAAVITTGGVLTGSGIAARGMTRRVQFVRTFDILPMHNNKRVNCILTVPGFLNGIQDDPRLPFSVLDPIVGDVFSVLWEPEMIRETGSALKILTTEVLTQIGQTVLQATVMTALMSALQWPIILTKLGYLIDNPWSNALDRAKAAGSILADILLHRRLGVRPITLIGFSLGARVIFYALIELAKAKAFGVVQDVFLLGASVTAPQKTWLQARGVVSGRFVNAFARNDWVLNYLFRATSGGLNTVAGLRPVENVPGLENVDVTDKIAGHMSYRTFMPLILDQLGFPVSADYFDEPEEPDFEGDRIVVREGDDKPKKKSWFSRGKNSDHKPSTSTSRPPSVSSFQSSKRSKTAPSAAPNDDDLPPRTSTPTPLSPGTGPQSSASASKEELPLHAGFDLDAIKAIIEDTERHPNEVSVPSPLGAGNSTTHISPPSPHTDVNLVRSQSAPPKPLPQVAVESESDIDVGEAAMTPRTRALDLSSTEFVSAGPSGGGRPPAREDFTSTFSRTLSLSDARMQGAEDALTSYANPNPGPSLSSNGSPSQFSRMFARNGSSPSESEPEADFGGALGVSASRDPYSSYSASSFGGGVVGGSGYGYQSHTRKEDEDEGTGTSWRAPPLPEKDPVSMYGWGAGSSSSTITASASPATAGSWAYSNPFRSNSTADFSSGMGGGAALSFGGMDGTVSTMESASPAGDAPALGLGGFGADPWASRSTSKFNKGAGAGFSSNPWS